MQRSRLLFAGIFAALTVALFTPTTSAAAKTDLNTFIRSNVQSGLANAVTTSTPANKNTNNASSSQGAASAESSANADSGAKAESTATPVQDNTGSTETPQPAETNNDTPVVADPAPSPKTSMPATIDTSAIKNGYVSVAYYEPSKKLKAYISLKGQTQTFSMRNDGNWTNIPLTLGSGEYEIRILYNTTGDKYSSVTSTKATYNEAGSMDRYLKSIPTIEYNSGMGAIKKAAALASGKSDADKVTAIYEYVVLNTSYDNAKVGNMPSGYEPSVEDTYNTHKGICYDYAALFAAMCRSQGIPTKLVKGYVKPVQGYHAWNAVYLDGQWKVVDTTSDAVYRAAGYKVGMYKDGAYVLSVTQEY